MFIEVTSALEGRPIAVNINKIKTYLPDGDSNKTLIEFGVDEYIVAKESYETVKDLIAHERLLLHLAEGGY